MKIHTSIIDFCTFFFLGGTAYYLLEILYRGYSHYSMFLGGGIIFYLISLFHRKYQTRLHLVTRMIISAMIITFVELLFGLYFNLHLHEQVWDYSLHYYNYKGQICLTFSILWFFLSLPVLLLESFLRRSLRTLQKF